MVFSKGPATEREAAGKSEAAEALEFFSPQIRPSKANTKQPNSTHLLSSVPYVSIQNKQTNKHKPTQNGQTLHFYTM
jgi:hypothetical protein